MQRLFRNRGISKIAKGVVENAFFDPRREELYLADGRPTGYDALLNSETNTLLSVVSDRYQLTTHKEASDLVHELLDSTGIEYTVEKRIASHHGAKFFETVQFPKYKFNPAQSMDNTSYDADKKKDEYIPTIIITNSYDRSSPVSWFYGAYRMVCSNGCVVGVTEQNVSIRHNQIVNKELIRERFGLSIEETIEGIKDSYLRLNAESAQEYAEKIFLTKAFPSAFGKNLAERMQNMINFELDVEKTNQDRDRIVIKGVSAKNISAYYLYQNVTEVVTHEIPNPSTQMDLNKKIASVFRM